MYLSSDHIAISLILSDSIILRESKPSLTSRLTNWQGFQNTLQERIKLNVPLKTREHLEEVEKLICDIQQAAWINTPETKRTLKGNNYPKEIRKLIAEKDVLDAYGRKTEHQQTKIY